MEISQKEETDKLYYSISEVSQMFELNASTLRFWEKEFEVLAPIKNKKGNRLFTKKDIEHIAIIVNLVKHKGFTLQGAKEQLKLRGQTKPTPEITLEVIEKLQKIKEKLIQLRNQID
jgi:DNA-binding transcriptional MerR regulator